MPHRNMHGVSHVAAGRTGAGGDSGGPIFNAYIEMGIVDAVNSNYTETYYSTIDWIDSVMGTTPCLSANC